MHLFPAYVLILHFTAFVQPYCYHKRICGRFKYHGPRSAQSLLDNVTAQREYPDPLTVIFKDYIFNELQIQEKADPSTLERVPRHLIRNFPTYSDPSNHYLPMILRATWFNMSIKPSDLTHFTFRLKTDIFKNVNHVLVNIYMPKPKKSYSNITVTSTNRGVTIKSITSKVEERGQWLVISFKMYYLQGFDNQRYIDVTIGINEREFKNLTHIKNRGAIVHVKSSLDRENIIEPRDTCDETSCCPVKMNIDFEKLGWAKWILKPKVFKLSFCSGTCESASNQYTFHSTILRRMIKTYKDKAPKTELCCAPHELYSYSIVYYDGDGMVHTKQIPEVEVKSCICT